MSADKTTPEDVPQVTMSNTKKELYAAYEAAREALEAQQEELLSAEEAREALKNKAAEAAAQAQEAQDPVRRLHDLRTDINRRLSELAQAFETEVESYEQVQRAVQNKQDELSALYDIEGAAGDLAALIQAQREKKETFETEMVERKAKLDAEIAETREAWDKEKAALEAEMAERKETIEREREREQEEYDYALKREREQKRNELQDELASVKREISAQREQFEEESAAKQAELDRREQTVAEQERELAELRERVASFPQELEVSVNRAVADTTERLQTQFESAKELLQARFEGEKNVLQSRIESLQSLVEGQRSELAALSAQQEKAYDKVQDIATRAVAASKHEVISIPAPQQGKSDRGEG